MITAFGTVQTAVEAMKSGGYDYIAKPIDYDGAHTSEVVRPDEITR